MSNEYIGRTIDILAYQGVPAAGLARLTGVLALPGQSGYICTGIQKLAQRFTVEFLTARGSMPYQPKRGTVFMVKASQGMLRTVEDVRSCFSEAMIDIFENLTNAETGTEPDDERYAGAELNSVTAEFGSVSLNISLYSKAGVNRTIIMPISTSLGRTA